MSNELFPITLLLLCILTALIVLGGSKRSRATIGVCLILASLATGAILMERNPIVFPIQNYSSLKNGTYYYENSFQVEDARTLLLLSWREDEDKSKNKYYAVFSPQPFPFPSGEKVIKKEKLLVPASTAVYTK